MIPEYLEIATMPGGEVNHDASGVRLNPNLVIWAIDGATALAPSGEDELQMFVRRVNEEIDYSFKNGASLKPLKMVMEKVADAVWPEFVDFPRLPWERPSCSVALARYDGKCLDYFVLGDAAVIVKNENEIQVLTDLAITVLDKKAIDEKVNLQKAGMTSREARAAIQETLRKHRAIMNTAEGYWIFNGDPVACRNAVSGTIFLPQGGSVIAATDGFTRLVSMGVYPNWLEVFAALENGESLRSLMLKLREAENADPECLEYPRFWIYDDATAVYAKI